MRYLFAIICCVFLSAEIASAEVCLTSGNRGPWSSHLSSACSVGGGFGDALSDFFRVGSFVSFSSVDWSPHRLTTSETGRPMVKQRIFAKVRSPEDVAKIQQERKKFLARMSRFATEVKPYLCRHRSTAAFLNAGGVAEFNLMVAAKEPYALFFSGPVATVFLDKESCEVL